MLSRDPQILCKVFKSIVRHHLEYCVQAWNPAACHGNWTIIMEVESVQRRFTRLADDIGMLPYSERLDHMKLTTLAERRIRGDLIETFKIVNGLVDYGKNVFKTSRRNNIVSKVNLGSTNSKEIDKLRSMFLPERIKNYWNNLPMYCKNSVDVNSFKINLDRFKKECIHSDDNNYWEVSNLILDKLEGNASYIDRKESHNAYLLDNPFIAKKKGINTYVRN